VLTRKAVAAISVGTYWTWETTATLSVRRRARRLGAHGGGEGRGHIVSPRAQRVYVFPVLHMDCVSVMNLDGWMEQSKLSELTGNGRGTHWLDFQRPRHPRRSDPRVGLITPICTLIEYYTV